MKGIIPVLFLFSVGVGTSLLYSQPSASVDSLRTQLDSYDPQDSVKWALLLNISRNYSLITPDSGIAYGEVANRLAKQLNNDELIFRSLNAIGFGYVMKNREEEGLRWFLKALALAKTHPEENWQKFQAQAYINIAGVFWQQQQIQKALIYARSANNLLEQLEEPKILADNYHSIGLMYRDIPELDSALFYLSKALNTYKILNMPAQQGRILYQIGRIYAEKQLYKESLLFLQKSLILAQQNSDFNSLPLIHNEMAKVFLKTGDYRQASTNLYQAIALEKGEPFQLEKVATYKLLADLHLQQNRFDSAYHFIKAHYELSELRLNKEKADKINELEITYQSQQKELENQELRDRNRIIKNRDLLLSLASMLLLAGIIVTLIYGYKLNKKNNIIALQKEEVEHLAAELTLSSKHLNALMEEKSHLISLITHDIQTPLSLIKFVIISAIAEHPEENLKADMETIALAAEKISYLSQRISDVQKSENLDITPELSVVSLSAIAKDTATLYIKWSEKKNIRVIEEMEKPEVLVKADAFLLSKAIGNVLGNAVKFSKPGKKVYLTISSFNKYGQIEIRDEGPGISIEDQQKAFQKFQKLSAKPTFGEPGTGNGLYLAKRYIEAMGGKITIGSTLGKGSTFTIQLPVADNESATTIRKNSSYSY